MTAKICCRVDCPLAGQPQPLSSFYRHRYSPSGHRYECAACTRREQKARRGRSGADFEITVEAPAPPSASPPSASPPSASPPPAPPPPDPDIAAIRDRVETSRLRADLREMEKHLLTASRLQEIVGSLGAPNVVPNPEWLKGAAHQRSTHGTAVLFLSDIHFDEVVSASQIRGVNEYNREIAVQRLHNTFRTAIVLLKGFMAAPKYDGMVLPLGGDLLSGNIHEELVETNEMPIQKSMIALEEVLIEGITGLADEFGKLHIPCVTGNHGRMHKKPRAKNRAFENYEWSIYQRLASHFRRDGRITFDIPDGPDAFFSVYDHRFCLSHGDQFRGGGGIGGIMVPIMRGLSKKQVRQAAVNDPFDCLMIGHWHQYIHTENLIINGSVKGYDEFADQNNFAFEPPRQALFVMHPEVGCTFRMPVVCSYEGGRVKAA